jgi:hypothetical protein
VGKRGGEVEGEREDVPTVHVAHHVDLSFCLSNLLLAGDLGLCAAEEHGHVCGFSFLLTRVCIAVRDWWLIWAGRCVSSRNLEIWRFGGSGCCGRLRRAGDDVVCRGF